MSYKIDRIENINFEIINILGERVFTLNNELPQTIGQYNKTFNISSLTNGTYFLTLSTLSYAEVLRFVVAQ